MIETNWSPQIERLLNFWNRQLNINQHLHEKASRNMKWWFYITGYPNMVLLAITGAGLFATYSNPCEKSDWVLASAICVTISAAINAIATFGNFGERSAVHYNTSTEYSTLSRDIDLNLNIPNIDKREDALILLNRVKVTYDGIRAHAPLIGNATDNGVNDLPNISLIQHYALQAEQIPNEEAVEPKPTPVPPRNETKRLQILDVVEQPDEKDELKDSSSESTSPHSPKPENTMSKSSHLGRKKSRKKLTSNGSVVIELNSGLDIKNSRESESPSSSQGTSYTLREEDKTLMKNLQFQMERLMNG